MTHSHDKKNTRRSEAGAYSYKLVPDQIGTSESRVNYVVDHSYVLGSFL